MQTIEIEIEPRQGNGSREARRVRRGGHIPAVVYARGEEALSTRIPMKEFVTAASRSRSSQIFTLKSSIPSLNGKSALVKGIQRDHLSGNLLHVDFQSLHENEEIDVEIPLRFVGESAGVKADGGILSITTHTITVSCLPKLIPDEVSINISELKIGDSIHAKDIALPEGVRLHQNPDETVVSVVAVRQTVEAAPATAGAEGAAAAAPTADGAAAAAPAEKAGK
jgi:large subunit ribosomal protein L25